VQVGDLVTYGASLGPQWKREGMGIVVEVSEFIRVVFPYNEGPNWYHPDNLELVSASR